MGKSRTYKSIKNSLVALTFYFVGLILQFFSRKIFLDYLGPEVLGLNTTATNLLQFLNIAELGVSSAISFTLYKPILEKDTNAINEIVSLQGWLYRNIALLIIACAIILMFFFPWIFSKTPLPIWYAYASFGVLLFSSLLSYFFNYKQIVLAADQKDYKIQYSYQSIMILKRIAQIFCITYFDNEYLWWLFLEFIFAIVGTVSLGITTKKTYPFLKTDISKGKLLQQKYPEVVLKIKQVFFHKIGTFALNQTSPIIIYAYASLTLVALYGNYMLVITGVIMLMNAMFNSMNAGIGNLVAEGNRDHSFAVFKEIFSIRYIFVCTVCYGVYTYTPNFISLWIGNEYLLENSTLALMVGVLYINTSRSTVDGFISAHGIFNDIWAPIIESLINIGLSIGLGYFFGLNGILSGVLISSILVILFWKPYWLFSRGFKLEISKYIIFYICQLAIGILVWIIVNCFSDFRIVVSNDYLEFIINVLVRSSLYFVLIVTGILIVNRRVRCRIKTILCAKFNNIQ